MEPINLFFIVWNIVIIFTLVIYVVQMVKAGLKTAFIPYLISAITTTIIVTFAMVLSYKLPIFPGGY